MGTNTGFYMGALETSGEGQVQDLQNNPISTCSPCHPGCAALSLGSPPFDLPEFCHNQFDGQYIHTRGSGSLSIASRWI